MSMSEEERRKSDNDWQGSPLEIVIEFDTGDEEVLKPKTRDEFKSYELSQTGVYLGTLAHQLK
jgi:hypothetical protein